MSIRETGVEFTRPKGNSYENRSKYAAHRVQSALPFRSGLSNSKQIFSLQQSPKISTGKRRRQKIIDYDYNDEVIENEIRTQKIDATVINHDKGDNKSNNDLEHSEVNPNNNISNGMNSLFSLQKYPIKLHLFDKKKSPPMRNDQFKPKRYDQFSELIRNCNRKYRQNSASCINLIKLYSNKNRHHIIMDNDIFRRKESYQDNELAHSHRSLSQLKRNQSDIFLNRNDRLSLNKTGQKDLFIEQIKDKYPIGRESASSWTTKAPHPTLLNYSTASYHLLNPNIRSISKTKREIVVKCNNNEYLTSRRQKSIAEFADLTHRSAKNVNKDFIAYVKQGNRCFHKIKTFY